ncbi:MAG: hypothetical protein U5L95_00935 [Candidatus Saccharibacteria bacterium]|nr:hypothetical protein [Candidatus Saccharibacteria bacterium]
MKALLGNQNQKRLSDFFGSRQHAAICAGEQLEQLTPVISEYLKQEYPGSVITRLEPEKSAITIDQIRALKQSLVLKRRDAQLVQIIEHADKMTLEAQNSFLKLLEEPPENVRFLLFTGAKSALLSTIVSRARIVRINRLDEQEATEFYAEQGVDPDELRRALMISRASPGRLFALLAGDSEYGHTIQRAKDLLRAPLWERLAQIDSLVKDKDGLYDLFLALDDVLRAATRSAQVSAPKLRAIAATREKIYEAQRALRSNANAKLVTLDVFLSL